MMPHPIKTPGEIKINKCDNWTGVVIWQDLSNLMFLSHVKIEKPLETTAFLFHCRWKYWNPRICN
jgi:hypothetical protein